MTNFDIKAFYKTTDKMEAETFAAFFAPEGQMVYANFDSMIGRASISNLAQSIFEQLNKIEHQVLNSIQFENTVYTEGKVHYSKKSGAEISLGFMTFIKLKNKNYIESYRVYIDPTPFFNT